MLTSRTRNDPPYTGTGKHSLDIAQERGDFVLAQENSLHDYADNVRRESALRERRMRLVSFYRDV